MRSRTPVFPLALIAAVALLAPGPRASRPGDGVEQSQQQPPQRPGELSLRISGEAGASPRFAVPDLIPLTGQAAIRAAAATVASVLWDDLAFEREFDMIPRDVYASIPRARSMTDVPFDRWREVGADAVVIGTVAQVDARRIRVQVRLFRVSDGSSAFAREYTGAADNPRFFAHTIADEIFEQQVALRGVARTKLAFVSKRGGERAAAMIGDREAKELYVCDYDGANVHRVTTDASLNITPSWAPDARAIAYTSYRRTVPDLFIANIYSGGEPQNPGGGKGQNFLPAFSPDGTRIAFMSNRDGNNEIYVMNRDGSGVQRLTHHPANDASPAWSPNGTMIAFTSDRTGSPQIYLMSADGQDVQKLTSEPYCDRPTWSPPPFNEIAYAARTRGGIEIVVVDLATRERRVLAGADGISESPVYAPNGRHLAFTTTRWGGRPQIATITRTGEDLRQITKEGSNSMPNWSR